MSSIRARDSDNEEAEDDEFLEQIAQEDSESSEEEHDDVPHTYSRPRKYSNPLAAPCSRDDAQLTRRSRRSSRLAKPARVHRDLDEDDEDLPKQKRRSNRGYFSGPMWRAIFSRAFMQAIVLAFVISLAVFLSPLAEMVVDRVPIAASIPQAKALISSLVTAVLVTATRPPAA